MTPIPATDVSSQAAMPNDAPTGVTVWPTGNNPCPTGWRVPTALEFEYLLYYGYASHDRTTYSGNIYGLRFTTNYDATTGTPAGNVIFFPAAGWRNASGAVGAINTGGNYWTADINAGNTSQARYLTFSTGNTGAVSNIDKLSSYPVRCVR